MFAAFVLAFSLALHIDSSHAFLNTGVGLTKVSKYQACSSLILTGQFPTQRRQSPQLCDVTMVASMSPTPATSVLQKSFRKPSGALTVAVQYLPINQIDEVSVQRLSLELRKQKAGVIFAEQDAAIFAAEQMRAKGNFPGPVPIVTCSSVSSEEDVLAVKTYGASGFLLKPWASGEASADTAALDAAQKLSAFAAQKGVDAIWQVHSSAQLDAAVGAGAAMLLLDCAGGAAEASALRSRIPKDRIAIATAAAMQPGNAEVADAGALRAAGFHGVVLSGACVGDAEDGEYVRWAAEALSSKASKEFKITGMTGHVNGHYGTGTFERSTAERLWRRRGAAVWAPASTNAAGRKSASPP